MKGYHTENGYMGYVDGEYQLFASEADYAEWIEEQKKLLVELSGCTIILPSMVYWPVE